MLAAAVELLLVGELLLVAVKVAKSAKQGK